MRLIFGLLIFFMVAYMCYEVQSVELRCPCTHNVLNRPIGGVFWIGRDPPKPPECDKPQHFLLTSQGKTVCLGPDHHITKWLDGQNSNSWYKVFITTNGNNGPQIHKRAEHNKRPKWKL
ncbi:chemokine vCXCL1 [Human betaherpesvirus 5]|uniref:Alpha-chemokine n=1 Tax=Human cytomegalovirus TaxID=10359 RepID=Q6SWE4_HCMV|nr:UL146 [Human betaherpesvirus 5]AAX18448.1 UL146 [Human betaherpesvirus 5]ABA02092.1 UL146 [Human betaherpesvirus 5]ACS92432.1 chemokine vCXCL1 [Human betaherpesvirus 5]ADP06529.1 alpha-chemokine [Human betaherpesvirus 5]